MLRASGILDSTRASQRLLVRNYASQNNRVALQPNRQQPSTTSKSHLQTKLNYFIETGQILKMSPSQFDRKKSLSRTRASLKMGHNYSLQKALLILKSKYDSKAFQKPDGSILDIHKLKPSDLKPDSEKALIIFKNLINMKTLAKISPDKRLLYTLLGTNDQQFKDPFLVTSDILKLLERDNNIDRAVYLAKLVDPKDAVVGMNAILQWLLERGDVQGAFKNYNDRKKWNIPVNSQTYVILFDGLAKSHMWGDVSDQLCDKVVDIFDRYRSQYTKDETSINNHAARKELIAKRCSIQHFNACLSLLVKNFKQDQEKAWTFFDKIIPDPKSKLPVLVADIQTFTILLDGVKRFSIDKSEEIKNNKQMPVNEKTLRLLEIQGKLVSTAEAILDKVLKEATPPVPPTREEVESNPQILDDYRAKSRRRLINIDPSFVSVFVSCFISSHFGTGHDIKSGSHYMYVQKGMEYLRLWCPEIDNLCNFVSKIDTESKPITPSKSLKYHTDLRLKTAIDKLALESSNVLIDEASATDVLPENITSVQPLQKSIINPEVVFPPPPSSKNKTRAIFSDKKKPLVDFTRVPIEDIKLLELHRAYETSRGKFGRKLSHDQLSILRRERAGVNKFLISNVLDGLLKLGRKEEFYLSIWFILSKWGGIEFQAEDILRIKTEGLRRGLLSELNVAHIDSLKQYETEQKHKEDIIDIMSVENLIFKLSEQFKTKGQTASHVIVEIFSSLANYSTNSFFSLKPRIKTADVIFSTLIKDLHYYNDYNYNISVLEKKEKNIPNNTPRKSITNGQLEFFLEDLNRFLESLITAEGRLHPHSPSKYLLPNVYLDSYNKIIDRIYRSTWIDTSEEQTLNHHKQIVRSGILLFRPQSLIDPRENLQFATPIIKSMEIVYNNLKDKQGLSTEDVIVMTNLKRIFQLDIEGQAGIDKYNNLAKKIQRALQIDTKQKNKVTIISKAVAEEENESKLPA
ncbi:hypothetical protein G9P44_002751 [Scheffersomyces stipitis]|nr:hypothetical protein G9P44_002751 [Scheffersomyces stipitis]